MISISHLISNIALIFSSYGLTIDFVSCAVFGFASFAGAIHLCGSKQVVHKMSKYLLGTVAIILASKVFLYLIDPDICVAHSPIQIIFEMSIGFVIAWTILEESPPFQKWHKSLRVK
jgi:hypothetical protein